MQGLPATPLLSISAPVGAPRPTFGLLFTQRCELCGTLRYDVISRFTGEMLTSPRE